MSWSSATAFYYHIGLFAQAGLPIGSAVAQAALASGGWHRSQGTSWSQGCLGGRTLSEQLAASGEQPVAVALIGAGEASGRLPEMAREVSQIFAQRVQMRRQLIARLAYPVMLVHAALMIPAVVPVFTSNASLATVLIGPAILWAVVAAAVVLGLFLHRSGIIARLALQPPLRFLALPYIAGNVCLVVRAAAGAGMLYPKALELAAGASGNQIVAERLRATASQLINGQIGTLAEAFNIVGLPTLVVEATVHAETAGVVEASLERAAHLQRELFEHRLAWAARFLIGIAVFVAMLTAVLTIVRMYSSMYIDQIKNVESEMDK